MVEVGINAHLLSGQPGYRQAGIHTYIKELLNHLPPSQQFNYTAFGAPGAGQHLARMPMRESRLPTENPLARIVWEQAVWPLVGRPFDLLHSMAFVTPVLSRVPKIVTVYDLSFMHYPDRFKRPKRLYLQTQTKRSVQEAIRVVTISESGRDDVHQLFDVPLDRIDVVTPGVGAEYKPFPTEAVAKFKQKHRLEKRVLLHVGTLQPRKNITTLIEALGILARPDIELVLVGGKGWLYDDIFARVEALGLREQVRFTDYVPAADLPLWYNAADLFVLPSVYEGFGMPAAQAMACGIPVIASNASSLPEVVGEAGLLFDPHDAQALANRIENVLDNSAQAMIMRDNGLDRVRKFSWQLSGRKIANCYQQAAQQIHQ